jgi:hypothetical protein
VSFTSGSRLVSERAAADVRARRDRTSDLTLITRLLAQPVVLGRSLSLASRSGGRVGGGPGNRQTSSPSSLLCVLALGPLGYVCTSPWRCSPTLRRIG